MTAQRPPLDERAEFLSTERPRGAFSRQLVLGDNEDRDRIESAYRNGVLRLVIPVEEGAKPRKITINSDANTDQAITAGGHNGHSYQRSDNTVDARLRGTHPRTGTTSAYRKSLPPGFIRQQALSG